MHIHMHWTSSCIAITQLSMWGWGRLGLQKLQCLLYSQQLNLSKFTIGIGGTSFNAFQTTQLKQTLEAKGPGPFPCWTCHPFCFALDHASVPLCGVAVLGLHMAYPRAHPMAHYMLEKSLPLAYPWLTPGPPLAHPWHTKSRGCPTPGTPWRTKF